MRVMSIDGRSREPFEPSSMNDPVAMQTKWTPCKRGGANFCTHKLVQDGPNRLHFRPTVGAVLFGLVFFGVGSTLIVVFVASLFTSQGPVGDKVTSLLIVSLVGGLFAGVGANQLWSGTVPIVFDLKRRLFWKGWDEPRAPRGEPTKTSAPLDRVHALQIISEYCSGKNSFWSYEVNLVLDDGSRINVIDHGNLSRVRTDARNLATALQIPLWDPS
jgi:hypothetical protein